jgi:hypothetical protein
MPETTQSRIAELKFIARLLLATLILASTKIENTELILKIDEVCDEAKKILDEN